MLSTFRDRMRQQAVAIADDFKSEWGTVDVFSLLNKSFCGHRILYCLQRVRRQAHNRTFPPRLAPALIQTAAAEVAAIKAKGAADGALAKEVRDRNNQK